MEEEDEYFVPLQDQRVFGAGVKRKRVKFIAAETTPFPSPPPIITAASERYLSIVLKDTNPATNEKATRPFSNAVEASTQFSSADESLICSICGLPFQIPSNDLSSTRHPHEASLAHQVCLTHSHPPSHIDRTRPGLKYLSSYGWDPDSRLGLGAAGEGIRTPIKGKIKNDTVGLGVDLKKKGSKVIGVQKVEKLDAKKVRVKEEIGRRKGEKLRELFYMNEDVERYLGASSMV
ncbi:MAG: hypothetical protein Q9187_006701 [Circinaria calcarea]